MHHAAEDLFWLKCLALAACNILAAAYFVPGKYAREKSTFPGDNRGQREYLVESL
jgi:hypothetical protein